MRLHRTIRKRVRVAIVLALSTLVLGSLYSPIIRIPASKANSPAAPNISAKTLLLASNTEYDGPPQENFWGNDCLWTTASVAYDSKNRFVYEADHCLNLVYILDAANSHKVVGAINVPMRNCLDRLAIPSPLVWPTIAFDSANNHVYIACSGPDGIHLIEIDANTNTLVKTSTIASSGLASDIIFDPDNGMLYVSTFQDPAYGGTNSLTVVDPTTDTITTSIQVPEYPLAITYDKMNRDMYVTGYVFFNNVQETSNVAVISTQTNTVVQNVPLAGYDMGIAYDSADNTIYVTDFYNGNVYMIDGQTNQISGVVYAGSAFTIEYDSTDSNLYVTVPDFFAVTTYWAATNSQGGHVGVGGITVIAGSSNTATNAVANLAPPTIIPSYANSCAMGMIDDPLAGHLIATDSCSGLGYDLSNGTITTAFPILPFPWMVAYGDGKIYVTDYNSPLVFIVNATTEAVMKTLVLPTIGPEFGIAFDGIDHKLYVTSGITSSVYIIDTTKDILEKTISLSGNGITDGAIPSGVAYDPSNGDMYVALYNCNITPTPQSPATVGGTVGTVWCLGSQKTGQGAQYYRGTVAVFSGSTDSLLGSVTVGGDPYYPAYDKASGQMYIGLYDYSGNVSIIDSKTNTWSGTISLGKNTAPTAMTFDPMNGDMYIGDSSNGYCFVVDGATNQLVTKFQLGSFPTFLPMLMAYNPIDNNIYATSAFFPYGAVEAISPSSNSVTATLQAGSQTHGIAVDPVSGKIFVANSFSSAGDLVIFSQPTFTIQITGLQTLNSQGTPQTTFTTGQLLQLSESLSNLGGSTRSTLAVVSVTDSYGRQMLTGTQPLTLDPGQQGTVLFFLTIPSTFPAGTYKATGQVWNGFRNQLGSSFQQLAQPVTATFTVSNG